MNENQEEGIGIVAGHQWRRNLYVLEMYMGKYWHMDYDVLMQEHIQLQKNSICHLTSELDREIDKLWRLI